MSRAYGYDSDYDQWQAIMYGANVRRALNGKKGKRNLRILLDALNEMEEALNYQFPEWMPHTGGPRLIASDLYKAGDVCAVGAFMRKQLPPAEFHEAINEWSGAVPDIEWRDEVYAYEERELTGRLSARAGLQPILAEYISAENDEPWDETPEQRFQRIRRWVQRQLTKATP